MSFSQYDFDPRILRGIHAAGYTSPTPIQSAALPPALAGRDLIGTAQTGTGKTAAFVLPMLQRLLPDPRVPDGAASSAGLWRVDLAPLGDATAPLTWQRLAKDNLAGIDGRSIIPSVFDWKQNRLFLMAGRGKTDLTELSDVWAVYPDVIGEACAGLDPYAPFASVPTPTPTGVPPTPPTPGGGPTKVPTAVPTSPGPVAPSVCPNLDKLVPRAAIDAAVANPASVQGYDQLCNPNLPASPNNPKRGRLGLQNPAGPFHPLFNSVVYKCGCP